MICKKRTINHSILPITFKKNVPFSLSNESLQFTLFEIESQNSDEPSISKVQAQYNETIDAFNRKSVNRLIREHQLFMNAFRNFEFENELRMQIEEA